MSAPSQTTARLLERSFRDLFAADAVLGAEISASAICLYLENQDIPADRAPRFLPAIIFSAKVTGQFKGIKIGGQWAELATLKVECRVDGTRPNSAGEIEALAQSALDVIELRARGKITGWKYLYFERGEDARGFDGPTRVVSLGFELRCFAA